jgi:HK97 family phage portal protein
VSYWNTGGPWWSGPIQESFTGAWQQNVVAAPVTTLLSFSAIYACVTGIASDIAKMRIKLSRNNNGVWEEITQSHGNSDQSPILSVLKKPNHFQTRIEFVEQWLISKLLYGNTYVLKQRSSDRTITELYVLHPRCVEPLVAENGDVYYKISRDYLSEVDDTRTVPASEIIHDRMPGLWHPLIGISPLYACSVSATMGNTIQSNSTHSFANGGRPSGIITVPGAITNETAVRLKNLWETQTGGVNVGKTGILSDGMVFTPVNMLSAEVMQLIEQLKWTVEDVARAFRYPHWKLGGPMPPYTKPELAMTAYYSDCLHPHIEKLELCLDEGLMVPEGTGTELDLDTLMRMDQDALYSSLKNASEFMKLNEQRNRANLRDTQGGDTVYKQEQEHAVEALWRRDQLPDPFGKTIAAPPAPATPAPTTPTPKRELEENLFHVRDEMGQRMIEASL